MQDAAYSCRPTLSHRQPAHTMAAEGMTSSPSTIDLLTCRLVRAPVAPAQNRRGLVATHHYVERPKDIAVIEEHLIPRSYGNINPRIFVLYGLGGIGKTQLAASFVKRHRTTFNAILWLDGRSEFDLRQSLADFGSEVWRGHCMQSKEPSHKHLLGLALDWLSNPCNARWLVVLDDVGGECGVHDNANGDYVKKYLPDNGGSVLITTRLTRLSQLGPSRALQPVDPAIGLDIIKNWIGCDNAENNRAYHLSRGLG